MGETNHPGIDARPERPDEPPRVLPHYTAGELICNEDGLGRKRYHTPDGRAVCGRLKNRRNRAIADEVCLAPPMPAGPCRVHGGPSPGAPLSAGGRYSRTLRKWKKRFDQALSDTALLDVRPDIAMMDTALVDLVARAEELDCPGWRGELLAAFEELNGAIRAGRQRSIGPALKQLEELIKKGADADRVASELTAAIDRRAERATRTLALKVRADERITTREVTILFANWVELLKTHLEEPAFRKLLPHLRELASSHEFPLPGSIDSVELEAAAAETLAELEGNDDEYDAD